MATELTNHNSQLQSMRGIAALTVLVAHCLVTFANGRIEVLTYQLRADNAVLTFLQVTVHGNSAVIFFYVLSGLVLGVSYRRGGTGAGSTAGFVVKRVFRLYPVMMLSVLLGAATLISVAGIVVPGVYAPLVGPMQVPVDGVTVLKNLLGIEYGLSPVLWSVQVEIVMIALFPLFIAISNRSSLAVDGAVLAALAFSDLWLWNPLPNPLRFVCWFYLGLILPRLVDDPRMRPWFSSGRVALLGLFAMALIEWLYVRGTLWLPYKFVTDAIISAQWIGFVLLRPELRSVKWLGWRPLVFLGDISYSLYAYSMTIQFALMGHLLPRVLSMAPTNDEATSLELMLVVATTAIAIPVASASYFLVERPLTDVGRILAKRVMDRRIPSGGARPLETFTRETI